MSESGSLDAVREAVRGACERGGCPHLFNEIVVEGEGLNTTIVRPLRALTDQEAFAMCRAWLSDYPLAGVVICPGDCPPECEWECVPNYDSEQIIFEKLPGLQRPMIGRSV